MGNYIDCQLKVEGPAKAIKKFKDLTLLINHDDKRLYCTIFKPLMPEIEMIISKKHIGALNNETLLDKSYMLVEDFSADFQFRYSDFETFYEWLGKGRKTDVAVINEPEYWHRLSLKENEIIVNFTSINTPPILLLIGGSKLFPELNFRLSFFDTVDESAFNSIEGINGVFKESDLKLYYAEFNTDEKLMKDSNGNWTYEKSGLPLIGQAELRTDILFDHNEANLISRECLEWF
jgi:hypothetical protein